MHASPFKQLQRYQLKIFQATGYTHKTLNTSYKLNVPFPLSRLQDRQSQAITGRRSVESRPAANDHYRRRDAVSRQAPLRRTVIPHNHTNYMVIDEDSIRFFPPKSSFTSRGESSFGVQQRWTCRTHDELHAPWWGKSSSHKKSTAAATPCAHIPSRQHFRVRCGIYCGQCRRGAIQYSGPDEILAGGHFHP